ncbi:STAS domain-containing protein [uncultured Methylobacterium sp.]|uniref:STAS domain-containing protein n=1 Tax=uncultured Methylobacterium sp. TaxID=157278 RepID=UPI0035CB3579
MSNPYSLRLSGDCGLRAIHALRDELAVALAASSAVEIDCAQAERIDLSFVQLVVSAARTARGADKRVAVTNLSEAAQAAFARAGLSPLTLASAT